MLSICIVNWNTRDLLRECLASIAAYPPKNDEVEVIVVDNASADCSAQMVSAEFPAVRLIASDENIGYAEGNNRAFEAAGGDLLLMLNPDTLLNQQTLTNAIAFLRRTPDAGAVGIRQVGADGQTQRSVRAFPTLSTVLFEALGLSRLLPRSKLFGAYRMTYFDYGRDAKVDQPMATFLLFPRTVYDEVGGLDTRFPIFFNDVDWCRRVKATGREVYYTPSAEITHYGGMGTGQAPKPRMIRESHESLIRYFEKYSDKEGPAWLVTVTTGLIRLGMLLRCAGRQRASVTTALRIPGVLIYSPISTEVPVIGITCPEGVICNL